MANKKKTAREQFEEALKDFNERTAARATAVAKTKKRIITIDGKEYEVIN
jgi:thymidylate kinase